MTPHNEQRLKQMQKEFIREVGIGQFSNYSFAIWLYENEPALSEFIIEAYLSIKAKSNV